jgi:hypothetical protein
MLVMTTFDIKLQALVMIIASNLVNISHKCTIPVSSDYNNLSRGSNPMKLSL